MNVTLNGIKLTFKFLSVTSSSIMLAACLIFRCFPVSSGVYPAISCIAKHMASLTLPYWVWLALLFGSAFDIPARCPIRNLRHPISSSKFKKNRHITILFLYILCSIMALPHIILQQSYLLNFITITVSSVALFIVPCARTRHSAESRSTPSYRE